MGRVRKRSAKAAVHRSCSGEQGSVMLREGLVSMTSAIRTSPKGESRKFFEKEIRIHREPKSDFGAPDLTRMHGLAAGALDSG